MRRSLIGTRAHKLLPLPCALFGRARGQLVAAARTLVAVARAEHSFALLATATSIMLIRRTEVDIASKSERDALNLSATTLPSALLRGRRERNSRARKQERRNSVASMACARVLGIDSDGAHSCRRRA